MLRWYEVRRKRLLSSLTCSKRLLRASVAITAQQSVKGICMTAVGVALPVSPQRVHMSRVGNSCGGKLHLHLCPYGSSEVPYPKP